MISTKDVAEMLGVSQTYIRFLCTNKKIRAVKTGRDWVVVETELQLRQRYKKTMDGTNKAFRKSRGLR